MKYKNGPLNLDKTVQKILIECVKWTETYLNRKRKRYDKIINPREKERMNKELTSQKNALKLLRTIANNPRKYLFREQDIIYTNVISSSGEDSIYNLLSPIIHISDDERVLDQILYKLSDMISREYRSYYTNKYGNSRDDEWYVYYDSWRASDYDLPTQLLNLSKYIHLKNAKNALSEFGMQFILPTSKRFAAYGYPETER